MAETLKGKPHRLRALKTLVNVHGLNAIDGRSAVAKALLAWRNELIRDLGGDISAQKATLVEMAVRTRLYVDHIDRWLMEQPRLVLTRKKSVLPVLMQRQQLTDSLARLLKELGLERVEKKIPSLAEFIASREAVDPAGEKE